MVKLSKLIRYFSAGAFFFMLTFPGIAQLDAWNYTRKVEIKEVTGNDTTNFQVLIELNTKAMVDAGKLNQFDGRDLRFAKDCRGFKLLNHWIEKDFNTTRTQVWVLMEELPGGETTEIYMFYGNPNASNVSIFGNVFLNPLILPATPELSEIGLDNPALIHHNRAGDTLPNYDSTDYESTGQVGYYLPHLVGTINLESYDWVEIKDGGFMNFNKDDSRDWKDSDTAANGFILIRDSVVHKLKISARKIKIDGILDGTGAGWDPSLGSNWNPDLLDPDSYNLSPAMGFGPGGGEALQVENNADGPLPDLGGSTPGGGGYGGPGGHGAYISGGEPPGRGGYAYGKADDREIYAGSGGGSTQYQGGFGGGCFSLHAASVEIGPNAKIWANGTDGEGKAARQGGTWGFGAGGGSGGGIMVEGYNVWMDGELEANGGLGGAQSGHGGGSGGGRIKIFHDNFILDNAQYSVVFGDTDKMYPEGQAVKTGSAMPGENGTLYKGSFDSEEPQITILPEVKTEDLKISASKTLVCFGDPVTITSTEIYGDKVLYVDGVPVDTNIDGIFTIDEVISDVDVFVTGGCPDTSNIISITVQVGENINVDPVDPLCSSDDPVQLKTDATGGNWVGPGVNPATGMFDPSLSGPGLINVYYRKNNAAGCPDVGSTVIEVMEPEIDMPEVDPFCENGIPTDLQANPSGGTWNGDGITDPVLGTFNPQEAGSGVAQVSYFYTDNLGCSVEVPLFILVEDEPTAYAGQDKEMCEGDTTRLSGTGAGTGGSYYWTPDELVVDPTRKSPDIFPVETTEFTLKVTTVNGCISYDEINMSVLKAPDVTHTPDTAICATTETELVAAGGEEFLWEPESAITGPNDAEKITINLTSDQTYTLKVTSNTGCVTIDSIRVAVMETPEMQVYNQYPEICSGDSAQVFVAGASTSYQWEPTTYVSDPGSSSPFIVPFKEITYKVTGTLGKCTVEKEVQVTLKSNPTINLPEKLLTCEGNDLKLDPTVAGNITAYIYEPATFLNDPNGAAPTFESPIEGNYTYTVTVKDNQGCINKDTFDLVVNPLPVAIPGADFIKCALDSISFGSVASPGNPIYRWEPKALVSDPSSINTRAINTESQEFTLTVIAGAGCEVEKTVQVDVTPGPDVSLAEQATVCKNEPYSIAISGGDSYTWYPAGAVSGPGNNPEIIPAEAGTYTVIAVEANSGCQTLDSIQVDLHPSINMSLAAATTVCANENLKLKVVSSDLGADYSWSPVNNLQNPNTSSPVFIPGNSTNYVVTALTSEGCTEQLSVPVTVKDLPLVDAGSDFSVCVGEQANLQGTGNGNVTWKPLTYLGNVNDLNTTLMPTASGSQTYTLEILEPATGCRSSDLVDVTFDPLPVVNAGMDDGYCEGTAYTFSGSSDMSNGLYQWLPSAMVQNDQSPNGTTTLTTSRNYTLQVTNPNTGCLGEDVIYLDIYPAIQAGIFQDTIICEESEFSLVASGAGMGGTYSWKPAQYVDDAQAANTPAHPDEPTIFSVWATSQYGCEDSAFVFVDVIGIPAPDFQDDAPQICQEDAIQIGFNENFPYWEISWKDDMGAELGNENLLPVGPGSQDATYQVVILDKRTLCVKDTTITVQRFTPFDPLLSNSGDICPGETVQLQAAPGAAAYFWNHQTMAGGSAFSDQPEETRDYHLRVIDNNGCESTETKEVVVYPEAVAHAYTEENHYIEGAYVELFAEGGIDFQWYPADGLSDPNSANPYFTATTDPLNSGFDLTNRAFYVVVTNAFGCLDTAWVEVEIEPTVDIYVTTGFSPDRDGTNDLFKVTPTEGVEVEMIKVFNRWGALVYESRDPNEGWDGYWNGELQPTGSYMFIVKGKTWRGLPIVKKGSVTILH